MAGDPFAVFRDEPGRHSTLKAVWPNLYDVLAGTGKHSGPPRAMYCVIGDCTEFGGGARGRRTRAVGRMWPNGHAACERHLKHAEIPGGYPLHRMTQEEAEFHRAEARQGR